MKSAYALFTTLAEALNAVAYHKTHNTGMNFLHIAEPSTTETPQKKQWTEQGVKAFFGQLGTIAECRVAIDQKGQLPSMAIIRFHRPTKMF